MAAWFKPLKAELRAILCGWLAVALILPALFGTASGHALTPAEQLYHQIEQANCIQSGTPAPDRDQHKVHDHECCLPALGAAQTLPLLADSDIEFAPSDSTTDFVAPGWSFPAHHPYDHNPGIPRGPPRTFLHLTSETRMASRHAVPFI